MQASGHNQHDYDDVSDHDPATDVTGAELEDLTDGGESTGHSHAVGASEVTMARIAGSTYSTVQHLQDIFHSVGWVSGGAVTDDADGTITVAAGTGLIRATDSAVAEILFCDWAAESGANVALANNDISYVYVEYNSGSPQVVATITERTDFNKNVLLAVVSREGTVLHINQTDQHTVGDHANSMIRRLKGVQPYGHVSGGILSETGTRNIAVTAGAFWRGLTEFTTSAIDTSGAPAFNYYYNDGAWQKVASVSDIHQTNYNDFGTGLATLSNNKYGVHWVYIEADSDSLAVVYGTGDYTLSQAEDAQPPSALPQHLQVEGILVGKIIIKKSGTAFTQVESAFQTKFVGSIASDHVDLAGLQGGTANEYYHLTSAEEVDLTDGGETTLHSHVPGGGADYDDISGNDAATDVTGAELEELTDASQTTLHSHAGGGETFVHRATPSADDWTKDTITCDNTWRELDMSGVVPAGAAGKRVRLQVLYKQNTVGRHFAVRKIGETYFRSVDRVNILVANEDHWQMVEAICDANRKIEFQCSVSPTTLGIIVTGWWI